MPNKGHALKPQNKQMMTGSNSEQSKVKRALVIRRSWYLNQEHCRDLRDLEEGVESKLGTGLRPYEISRKTSLGLQFKT